MTQKPLRIVAWLVLLMLAFFTLSPIELRPHTALPADVERMAAFMVTGLLFAAAYPKRIWLAAIIVMISVFGLEWMQTLRPDRHGQIDDALVKATGACAGLGLGWIAHKMHRHLRRQQP
ncbi:VanZ family protein [Oricola nitratireducens]|uniref:VanZ family protein n=1 Tax=Oricola nitratireducens TaxID=2775868 RepID=UPI001867E0F9|nr:VanZ family protein [Oricola nitratireducens]